MPQKESLDLINTCEDIRRGHRPETAILSSVKMNCRHYFDLKNICYGECLIENKMKQEVDTNTELRSGLRRWDNSFFLYFFNEGGPV